MKKFLLYELSYKDLFLNFAYLEYFAKLFVKMVNGITLTPPGINESLLSFSRERKRTCNILSYVAH